MSETEMIVERARRIRASLKRTRRDPRYQRVLGRLVAANVFDTTEAIEPHQFPIAIEDALWAGRPGRLEPRILELLPALIVKRPSLFVTIEHLPDDLRDAVAAVRRNNRQPEGFRGIPGADLLRWPPIVGRKNKLPSQLKSYRMHTQDLDLLDRLSRTWGISQTAVMRRAPKEFAARVLP